nr:NTP transferase domain-containing protein [Methanobacterium formicicum]
MNGVSCIITAAGKNRRMREDLKSKGMEIRHKLLLEINGDPLINFTVKNALRTDIDECIVVLGHFMDELYPVLESITDSRLHIIENPEVEVELSQTLLNGVLNSKYDYCLCLAGDQPLSPLLPYRTSWTSLPIARTPRIQYLFWPEAEPDILIVLKD